MNDSNNNEAEGVKGPHFEIDPSVVYQLGEALISDEIQALIEIIKNSYDADASYAKVIINTNDNLQDKKDELGSVEARYPINAKNSQKSDIGFIIVEDDGFGMNKQEIETGWLRISNRKKKAFKEAKKVTPKKKRTPLGDKGLGRLGVQRLGENIDIFTKSEKESGYHFAFSWLDFETAPNIENVDIHFSDTTKIKKVGTKIIISALNNLDYWRGQKEIKRLEQELSKMISPYKEIREFNVYIEVDGKKLELLEISEKTRDLASLRYSIDFNGEELEINAKVKLSYFRRSDDKDNQLFTSLIEVDEGQMFYDYLSHDNKAKNLNLIKCKRGNWFIEYSRKRNISDIDKVETVNIKNNKSVANLIANPGIFVGEVDSFDYSANSFNQQSIFDKLSDYKNAIKAFGGIRIYRDGFAIRVSKDWLNLGGQATSGASYYGLRPENTHGFVSLSALNNMVLAEKTDREGFIETPYYRNFNLLFQEFKKFSDESQKILGRSYNEFKKTRAENLANLDSSKTINDITNQIKKSVVEAANHQNSLKIFQNRLQNNLSSSKNVVTKIQQGTELNPAIKKQVAEVLEYLEPLILEAQETIPKISNYLNGLDDISNLGQVLNDRAEGMQRQIEDMYEAIALGLTAEALSHEIFNIADQLATRTKGAQTRLKNKGIEDRTIFSFVEYVNSTVMALRKQVSFLNPSLRYVREKRENIELEQFINELKDFHSNKFNKNALDIEVLNVNNRKLNLYMNRGKLSQIIDNIILNSEYWLKEDISKDRLSKGLITFEITDSSVCIYDNGRGIDPVYEATIFEPFVSGKKDGRGLGLFIIKQLLDSEGCNIDIVPKRNKYKRLYKFKIDFKGAING